MKICSLIKLEIYMFSFQFRIKIVLYTLLTEESTILRKLYLLASLNPTVLCEALTRCYYE